MPTGLCRVEHHESATTAHHVTGLRHRFNAILAEEPRPFLRRADDGIVKVKVNRQFIAPLSGFPIAMLKNIERHA